MLASSKIAILCASIVLAVPACTLALGDFDPASTSTTGGVGGVGGMATVGNGGTTSVTAVGASVAGSGGATASAASASSSSGVIASSSSGEGCVPACPMSTVPCKVATCVGSTCMDLNATQGTQCAGGMCDDAGDCVPVIGSSAESSSSAASSSSGAGCIDSSSCPPTGNVCVQPACIGGVCSTKFSPNGMKTSSQFPGDCHVNECDGAGNIVSVVDNTDTPLPLNDCTVGACSGGTPKQGNLSPDSPCMSNGGKVCDGSGNCVQCNLGSQCMSGACSNHQCIMLTACTVDGAQDGSETDIDCGGPSCQKCPPKEKCLVNADCTGNDCLMFVCGP